MKRMLAMFLVLCMVLTLLPGTVLAAEIDSGTCGDNVTWSLDDRGMTKLENTVEAEFVRDDGKGVYIRRPAQKFAVWPEDAMELPVGYMGILYYFKFDDSWTNHELWEADEVMRLPDGLTLDQSTGVISGTPTKVGTWYFKVDANSSGFGVELFRIRLPAWTP